MENTIKKSIITVDENGYVTGYANFLAEGTEMPNSIELDELPEDIEFEYSHYRLIDGILTKQEDYISEEDRNGIRAMRSTECFSIVDRPLWLDSLTEERLNEVKEWYRQWLDAPETTVIPEKPSWIK